MARASRLRLFVVDGRSVVFSPRFCAPRVFDVSAVTCFWIHIYFFFDFACGKATFMSATCWNLQVNMYFFYWKKKYDYFLFCLYMNFCVSASWVSYTNRSTKRFLIVPFTYFPAPKGFIIKIDPCRYVTSVRIIPEKNIFFILHFWGMVVNVWNFLLVPSFWKTSIKIEKEFMT